MITVGAADLAGTADPSDDFAAPWSAYGYTYDGFRKPELGASGRYMVGAVPASATLTSERPDNVVAPGYMQLSGTSFAAPVVAGSAAHVLAAHPEYTPDEVKAALMVTARPTGCRAVFARRRRGGRGAGRDRRRAAPEPERRARGLPRDATATFDSDAWQSAAQSDANWNSANWNQANWNSANWNAANWNQANWNSANWNQANWNTANWNQANWNQANWNAANWNADAGREAAALGDSLSGGYSSPPTPCRARCRPAAHAAAVT